MTSVLDNFIEAPILVTRTEAHNGTVTKGREAPDKFIANQSNNTTTVTEAREAPDRLHILKKRF